MKWKQFLNISLLGSFCKSFYLRLVNKDNLFIISILFVVGLCVLKIWFGSNIWAILGGFFMGGFLFYFLDNSIVYSDNLIVRSLQLFLLNFIVIIVTMICIFSIGLYFDFNVVECSSSDSSNNKEILKVEESKDGKYTFSADKNTVIEICKGAVKTIAPEAGKVLSDVGIAAGASTLGAKVFTATAGAPPVFRAAAAVGTTVTSYTGMQLVKMTTDYVRGGALGRPVSSTTNNIITNVYNSNGTVGTSQSGSSHIPGDKFMGSFFDNFDLNIFNFDNLSSLEGLIKIMVNSNIIISISVIFILIGIFNIYIIPYISKYILNIIDINISNEKTKSRIKNIFNFNNKINKYFWLIIICVNSLVVICLILLNFYISNELNNNLDFYIQEYNIFHNLDIDKKSMLFCINTKTILNSRSYSVVSSENTKSDKNNKNFHLVLDNSKTIDYLNRKNTIYKIYDNIFIDKNMSNINFKSYYRDPINPTNINQIYSVSEISDNFIKNITTVLEDIYDSAGNEFVCFKFYLLVKQPSSSNQFDFINLLKHFNKYSTYFINNGENIIKFYKNTSLFYVIDVLVWYTLYNITNLYSMSGQFKQGILNNIEIINKNVHKDWGKRINNNKSSKGRNYSTNSNRNNIDEYNNLNFLNKNNSETILANAKNLTTSVGIYHLESPIFKELNFYLSNKNNFNTETQVQIELFLKNQYLTILNNKQIIEDKKQKDVNFNLINNKFSEILSNSKDDLIKLISFYKNNLGFNNNNLENKIIQNSDNEYIINILYGRLFKIISNNNRLNDNTKHINICLDLGNDLINEYILKLFKDRKLNNKILFNTWLNDNKDIDILNIKFDKENKKYLNLKASLGNILIGWLITLELLEINVITSGYRQKDTILIPGLKFLNFLNNITNNKKIKSFLSHLPNKIPMIVEPKPYRIISQDKYELGGYLLNDIEYSENIIYSNHELNYESKILENNSIVDMINNVNSVEFKINNNVLDFILNNNNKFNFFTHVDFIHPLSKQSKLTKSEKKELESFNSKKDLEQNILGLAMLFKNIDCFYLPTRLDYRGRLYNISEYLNYQSIELAKALLTFSKNEVIDLNDEIAINYLKIFGANNYGNGLEKKSFDLRIKWVNDNINNIINFENEVLLLEAENKLLFISFCYEFRKYIEAKNNNQENFLSNLPIQLDASCNGFQHLTLLIDDISLAKELNLTTSKWNEPPKDFYTFIGLNIKEYFLNKLNNNKLNDEDKISFNKLASIKIHRKLIKKPIMTLPYNAAADSMINYIKDEFYQYKNENPTDDKDYYIYKLKTDNNIIFYQKDFIHLRKAIDDVIYLKFDKLKILKNYLLDIANISSKLGIPIPWILPSGLEINQQFLESEIIKIKPFSYTKNLLNLSITKKNKFNDNKQKRALMPNLIHSLDAASLALVIDTFFKDLKNKSFYSVHDCFAVHCNKVSLIMSLIKTAYYLIYSKEIYLLKFDEKFMDSIKDHFGINNVFFNKTNNKLIIYPNNKITKLITLDYPDVHLIFNDHISTTNVDGILHKLNYKIEVNPKDSSYITS